MKMRRFRAGWGLIAALAAAGVVLGAAPLALVPEGAQDGRSIVPDAPEPALQALVAKPYALPDRLPDKPSQPPAFTLPVEPLGFSAPGALYLGLRDSFVSLDFIDENRLLFTFRVPGLIHREAGESVARQIRAVVLTLPAGTVEAEALWTVHDRQRYLWMIKDGYFLLRDRENLELGDASLVRKPDLRFPGPLIWLEMDPSQQFLVTNTREPAAGKPAGVPDLSDPMPDAGQVVRILRRDSGKVLLVSRSRSTVDLPINAEGYLESLRGSGGAWWLQLNYFSGGSAILGQIDSSCPPHLDFLSEREFLATVCAPAGGGKLVAMTTEGRRLWEAQTAGTALWPLLVRAPGGLRLAWEALALAQPVKARASIDPDEIKGQLVEILDAADGRVALETAATPVLDAGGNVSISPSGRRVAVLNGGAIQVFELPPPPPLLESPQSRTHER